jgi:general nucleoside transport system permease protein
MNGRKAIQAFAEPAAAIGLALLVGGIGIFLLSGLVPGRNPLDPSLPIEAYVALISGVASFNGLTSTLVFATPLILGGLGVAVGFKAGLFNIGGRGQFLMGSVGSAAVVLAIGPTAGPWLTIPLAILAGAAAGAIAGFIPGFLKATSGAHEVVTTIMLNYILYYTSNWAIKGPLTLPRAPQPTTHDVSAMNGALYIIPGTRDLHIGVVIALVAVPLIWFLLYKTTLGFEIRAAGANQDAARYAGMQTRRLIVLTMSLSGLLMGLAGSVTLLGVVHQTSFGYDTGIGFDAITVALLARSNPIGVLFSGLLLGAMRAGSPAMQSQAGVPPDLIDALQAIILLFLVVNILRRFLARRRAGGPKPELAPLSEGKYSTEPVQ